MHARTLQRFVLSCEFNKLPSFPSSPFNSLGTYILSGGYTVRLPPKKASYTKKTAWSPKPDVSSGNTWARPSAREYEQAYLAWSLPNNALAPPEMANDPLNPKVVLVRYI